MLIVALLALTLSMDNKNFLECANHEKDADRLACFDAIVKAQESESAPDKKPTLNGYEVAIDSYLATTLKDPTSVTQYQITSTFSCSKILPGFDGSCACWNANSKNSYGAYSGKTTNVIFLHELSEGSNLWMGLDSQEVTTGKGLQVCHEANFVARDVALVKAQID